MKAGKIILKNIIQNEQINEYRLFKDFCLFKEKGLRKEAFKSLNSFIEVVKEWNTKKQQSFVYWLFDLFEISEDIDVTINRNDLFCDGTSDRKGNLKLWSI